MATAMAQKKLVDTVTGIQKNIHVKSYVADVPFPSLPSNPVSVQPVLVDSIAVPNPVVSSASSRSGTWVQVVEETKALGGLAVNRNILGLPKKQHIVLRGNKNISSSESGGLKVVPRRLSAFVGRLHIRYIGRTTEKIYG